MEDKIKIYIPESINNILVKDMELFEFFKRDGSLNKNEFLNTLIVNYYEIYQKNNSDIYEFVNNIISSNTDIKDYEANDLASSIVNYVENKTYKLEGNKSEVVLSLKPTRYSTNVIDYIQNILSVNTTLSNYFRNLLASYTSLTRDKRERIIFKDKIEIIEHALELKRKIYLTNKKNNNYILNPYSVSNSKEELFNYLVCEKDNTPFSLRISRIKSVVILNEASFIKESNIKYYEKMIKYGPQFAYRTDEDLEIIVKLNDNGKRMYKTMYFHRPEVIKIEDDLYYFDCSIQQALQYFYRLGRNAVVIKPKLLADSIKNDHITASRVYHKENI